MQQDRPACRCPPPSRSRRTRGWMEADPRRLVGGSSAPRRGAQPALRRETHRGVGDGHREPRRPTPPLPDRRILPLRSNPRRLAPSKRFGRKPGSTIAARVAGRTRPMSATRRPVLHAGHPGAAVPDAPARLRRGRTQVHPARRRGTREQDAHPSFPLRGGRGHAWARPAARRGRP